MLQIVKFVLLVQTAKFTKLPNTINDNRSNQVYDLVEWSFGETFLKKLGFYLILDQR